MGRTIESDGGYRLEKSITGTFHIYDGNAIVAEFGADDKRNAVRTYSELVFEGISPLDQPFPTKIGYGRSKKSRRM